MAEADRGLDDLLDVPTVAEILHVSTRTVTRLIEDGRGELPAMKVGSRWKIRREDIIAYLIKRNPGSVYNMEALDALIQQKLKSTETDTSTASLLEALAASYDILIRCRGQVIHKGSGSIDNLKTVNTAIDAIIQLRNKIVHGKARSIHDLKMIEDALDIMTQQQINIIRGEQGLITNIGVLDVAIDAIMQQRFRIIHEKSEPEYSEQISEPETKLIEQESEVVKQKTLLELKRQELELEMQMLDIRRRFFEIEAKRMDYALETASKIIQMLQPDIDAQARSALLRTLVPSLLQLGNQRKLEVALPGSQSNEIEHPIYPSGLKAEYAILEWLKAKHYDIQVDRGGFDFIVIQPNGTKVGIQIKARSKRSPKKEVKDIQQLINAYDNMEELDRSALFLVYGDLNSANLSLSDLYTYKDDLDLSSERLVAIGSILADGQFELVGSVPSSIFGEG